MTRRLFYEDSHLAEFSAVVTSCVKADNGFEVELDRTAFFPEGGGQPADVGRLESVDVKYTFLHGDRIIHLTDAPLAVGATVNGSLDWERRFRNMQNHTGEHIVSGLVHRSFGYNNVGFHMGEDGVIVDFDGYISPEELSDIEMAANRAVMENRLVTTSFPAASELSALSYRSKLELTEDVRLVTIDGYDVCACCAPHVSATGEIGVIKIFESIRRKNGVRLRMCSGLDALEDCRKRAKSVTEISTLLSAKPDEVTLSVERIIKERDAAVYELGGAKRALITIKTENLEKASGNLVFFEPSFSTDDLRILVNSALYACDGICAAFSGNDVDGYKYVMASGSVDLRAKAGEINSALSGRGGGKPDMISGNALATKAVIQEYFNI